MRRSPVLVARLLLAAAACLAGSSAVRADGGARLFKSGTVQVSADGRRLFAASPKDPAAHLVDLDGETHRAFPLPCAPTGVAAREDGTESWWTCELDRVVVLDRAGQLTEIAMPWGSAPAFAAFSRDQATVAVSLRRGDGVAIFDAGTRALRAVVATGRAPRGLAWDEDGFLWVTHEGTDGKASHVAAIDVSGPKPILRARPRMPVQEPRRSSLLAAGDLAEGGAVLLTGHPAQRPGSRDLWLPSAHLAFDEDMPGPDTTAQAALHFVGIDSLRLHDERRIVLSAQFVHDPHAPDVVLGPGWNLSACTPADVAFSTSGATAWVLNVSSEDILEVPSNLPAWFTGADAIPARTAVGAKPTGFAVHPQARLAYVLNELDGNVSVVDLQRGTTWRSIPLWTGRDPQLALGERVFFRSNDRRISSNGKVACVSCHPDGEEDGLTWAFQELATPLGPRGTTSLLGLSRTFSGRDPATGLGQLHRSGDRDEVQDFEHTFRGQQMGGTGFFSAFDPPECYLCQPNSASSAEIDALAAWMLSLPAPARSPQRIAGALSPAARRGARLFSHASASERACASCHRADRGFADFAFHDVGSARPSEEVELRTRTQAWLVNTPTLLGLFATAPYDEAGMKGRTRPEIVDAVDALARQGTHGLADDMGLLQREDLAEFLLSIDGGTAGGDVAAVPVEPPTLVSVRPLSSTRLLARFSAPMRAADVGNPAAWRIAGPDGTAALPVAAVPDPALADRVVLVLAGVPPCRPYAMTVSCAGVRSLSGVDGLGPMIDPADAANVHVVTLDRTITVTIGESPEAMIQAAVHDATPEGPQSPSTSDEAAWPRRDGDRVVPAFVRHEWRAALVAATGLTSAADILDATLALTPESGAPVPLELRRVLRAWREEDHGLFGGGIASGPRWSGGVAPWAQPGASALGGIGLSPEEYAADADLSAVVASADPDDLGSPVVFGGPGVLASYRFWFGHPELDFGHALRPAEDGEIRFVPNETLHGRRGPMLALTLRLPDVPERPAEISGVASLLPLRVARLATGELSLAHESAPGGARVAALEGVLGAWDAATVLSCSDAGTASLVATPGAGDRFYVVAAQGASPGCGGLTGSSSDGLPRAIPPIDCGP